MNIELMKQQAGQLLSDNATTILTGVGVIGTVATAVLAGKATLQAKTALDEQKSAWTEKDHKTYLEQDGHGGATQLTNADKARVVWPYFVPPVAVGSATIVSIIMANRMSAQRAAALAAAYGISESRFKEYREKVAEKLTGPKTRAIDDELAQDRVKNNPPSDEVLILASGEVLCYDQYSARYFRSTMENLKKAENTINAELFHHQFASLTFFYEEVGLGQTGFSDDVGWNMAELDRSVFELRYTTVLSPDEKPCIAFEFTTPPYPNYTKLY